ncbi:hypothetical protein N3K66_001641 [Trichothecium roseum]|uniref:Uncharacterized protein n=1 Tax=Trichothecium roseum TaxID=47278 RepID=A0ACC0V7C2_9HYPO|nr:hypothetical protein N3K66_001641 [Trichothecium roseum]
MELFTTNTATPEIKGQNKTVQHSISEVHGHASDSGQSSEENIVTSVRQVAARTEEDDEKRDRYWKEAFEGYEAVHFPTLPKSLKEIVADTTIQHPLLPLEGTVRDISISTLVRAAWGLVASGMAGTEDVTLGVAAPLKDMPVADQDVKVRPTTTLVPMRIETAGNQKVVDYLQTVKDNGAEIIRSCHPRLEDIAALSRHCRQACNFQTLLVTGQNETSASTGDAGRHVDVSEWTSNYGLILALYQASHEAAVQATFDANVIEPWVVTNLLQQIAHVVNQLSRAGAEAQLGDITRVTAPDLQQIWEWNAAAAIPAEESIHDIVGQMALTRPNATAIHSWDGDLTYSELDVLSTDLATRLVSQGVGVGCFVLLCFEKSKWATVSMLAMSKTGGAFVLLDPSLPLQRLKSISRQVNATMVLSSGANHSLASQLCKKVLDVSHELFEENPSDTATNLPDVDLDSVIYAVFTSGTTGTPKGALIHHRSSASAVLHQTQAFGYTPETRVYDFSTYSFDGSVLNAFTVFAAGGCLCVPTDEGRKSMLAESMESLTANTVFLTPSVAELLTPEQVPHLTSMIIGGEAVRVNDIQPWWDAPGVNVFTIYGPSECTPVSMVNPNPSTPEEAIRLGWGAGQVTWVVDPEDHDILVPLGCVGELLLEGPLVGAGYLGEPEKTASVFIESPSWLTKGGPSDQPGRTSRLYKTGDLVRYNSDGSLTFVDRKDTQVKIRGQRVELGEVEFFFYEHTGAREAVAEVIRPGGVEDNATLVVYLSLDEDTHIGDSAVQQSLSMDELGRVGLLLDLGELGQKMSQSLPRYMIPSACFCVSRRLPRTPNGKMNRKLLRELGSRISPQQLAHLQVLGGAKKRRPETAIESQLQALWAKNLSIAAASIGLDDSFFQLGGNSIGAMRLVNQARTEGLHFSVSTIFQTPTLGDLASKVEVLPHAQYTDTNDGPPPPFSLLQMSAQEAEATRRELAARYKIEPAVIEDIYPCTPLQQGILSISARGGAGSNEYVYRGVLEIAPNVDKERLQKAWQDAAHAMPIVRTRIVQHKDLGLVQMVLDKDLPWKHADDLEAYIALDKSDPMGLGDALCRFAVVHEDGGIRKLVWTLHHAIYDGWSLSMIEDTVSRLYNSTDLVVRPGFNTFIQYLEKADSAQATDYWRSYFVDGDFIAFPAVPSSMQGVPIVADSVIERQCSLLPRPSHDMTVSTLIRGALSIVLGQYTGSEDVVFGCTVWGRNAPVAGVGDINGPAFATVPIRAQISGADTLSEFLGTLQRDAIKMIDHEQTGLSKIAASSDDARSACDFQTLLVIQTEDEPSVSPFGTWKTVSGWEAFSTYALTLNCFLQENEESVIIKAAFDARVVETWKVDQVLSQLNLVISQLLTASPDKTVGGLQSLTPEDTALIQRLNGFDPPNRAALVGFIVLDSDPGDLVGQDADEVLQLIQKTLEGVLPRYMVPSMLLPLTELPKTTTGKTNRKRLREMGLQTSAQEASKAKSAGKGKKQPKTEMERRLREMWAAALAVSPESIGVEDNFFRLGGDSISAMSYLAENEKASMGLGDPLYRLALTGSNTASKPEYLVWTLHHALYDGWSFPMIEDTVQRIYDERPLIPRQPFNTFVSYVLEVGRSEEAAAYWRSCFDGAEFAPFPALPAGIREPEADTVVHQQYNRSKFAQAAQFLETMQQAGTDMMPYEHMGLQGIAKLSEDARRAAEFQTLLIINPEGSDMESTSAFGKWETVSGVEAFSTYAVTLNCSLGEQSIKIDAGFDSRIIDSWSVRKLMDQLDQNISQLVALAGSSGSTIADIDGLSAMDKSLLATWNKELPSPREELVHERIAIMAKNDPDATAISGWDGELSYSQLDAFSTALAKRLYTHPQFTPNTIVPLCFEKSVYTIVAMYAVLKAGAAFVLLDPSQPESRLRNIMDKVEGRLVVTSAANEALSKQLSEHTLTVSAQTVKELMDSDVALPKAVPGSLLYVCFTSGSTGTPKGAMVSHGSFSSAVHYQSDLLGLGKGSRMFDFVSYTFDVSIYNMLATLLVGGCVCVPSEQDRLGGELTGAINATRASIVTLTPSVARLVDTEQIRHLQTVVLLGEAVSSSDVERWQNRSIRVVNAYGPAETSVLATVNPEIQDAKFAHDIGRGAGALTSEVGLSLITNYQGIQKALSRSLPRYMIPAIFFSVREMPRTSSGKTDRVRLGKLASAFSTHELAELQTHRPDKRAPVTDRQRVMQRLWAGVLHVEESRIGLDDTFFELGGDSISAMRLVGQAKASGIKLSMAAIFDQPELEAVARTSLAIGDDGCNTTAPFSLLSPEADVYKLRLRVARDCDIEATDIEDMYPCTPLQED